MAREREHATKADRAVLEVLWAQELATIRSISGQVCPGGGAAQHATVQKLLERLESKGCVRWQRSRIPHQFRARIDRGRLVADRLCGVADSLCGGSMAPLLTHLLESTRLSEADVAALRDVVRVQERPGARS